MDLKGWPDLTLNFQKKHLLEAVFAIHHSQATVSTFPCNINIIHTLRHWKCMSVCKGQVVQAHILDFFFNFFFLIMTKGNCNKNV